MTRRHEASACQGTNEVRAEDTVFRWQFRGQATACGVTDLISRSGLQARVSCTKHLSTARLQEMMQTVELRQKLCGALETIAFPRAGSVDATGCRDAMHSRSASQ